MKQYIIAVINDKYTNYCLYNLAHQVQQATAEALVQIYPRLFILCSPFMSLCMDVLIKAKSLHLGSR